MACSSDTSLLFDKNLSYCPGSMVQTSNILLNNTSAMLTLENLCNPKPYQLCTVSIIYHSRFGQMVQVTGLIYVEYFSGLALNLCFLTIFSRTIQLIIQNILKGVESMSQSFDCCFLNSLSPRNLAL